jgi:hypothetical protein
MSLPIFHFSKHSNLEGLMLNIYHPIDRLDSIGSHASSLQSFLYASLVLLKWPPGRLILSITPFFEAWEGGSG